MTRTRPTLTHLTSKGHARMVDVGKKDVTVRRAIARAHVRMSAETFDRLSSGQTPKGDVLAVARVAAIQAAKRTSEWIPMCHAIALTHVEVAIHLTEGCAIVDATTQALDRTGVEMEAMVAASTAALTLYDMLKAIDRDIDFDVHLVEKSGGKTGSWRRAKAMATTTRSSRKRST